MFRIIIIRVITVVVMLLWSLALTINNNCIMRMSRNRMIIIIIV